MIALTLPEPLMLALRWALFLGPIALVLALVRLRGLNRRAQIGGLFAFLYGAGMIFVTHQVALHMGWWRYGWDALMLRGMPVDILLGGAVLFGPGLAFAFPNTRPLLICLPIVIGLHGTIFSSLEPLVFAGPGWFLGVVFVFALAHIPAIYLAKWTEADTHLGARCALLAVMTGTMMFALLPSLIMTAMGGDWALFERPLWSYALALPLLAVTCLIGVSANQMLCLEGDGTPIPLDPTKRLVRSGIYAYVSNPMQLSAALSWLILGAFLQNLWIMAAAAMAWVFVQGMVRWHHRHDLLKRFPDGWPEYKANVPEWRPRWRPWMPETATLALPHGHWATRVFAAASGLTLTHGPATYTPAHNRHSYAGWTALAMALTHVNFATALIGQALLLIAVPLQRLCARRASAPAPA